MLDFTKPLGDTVKKARTELGLTQVNVAERAAIDSRTILNIENYNGNPKMEILFPLVRTLQIDPWEIFYPNMKNPNEALRHMQIFLQECSNEEIEAMLPICKALLTVLRTQKSIRIPDHT